MSNLNRNAVRIDKTAHPGVWSGGWVLIRRTELDGYVMHGMLPARGGMHLCASSLHELADHASLHGLQPLCFHRSELEAHAHSHGLIFSAEHIVVVPSVKHTDRVYDAVADVPGTFHAGPSNAPLVSLPDATPSVHTSEVLDELG